MKPVSRFRHIVVDKQSIVPIFQQVAQSVVQAVKNGRLKNEQRLPSINLLSERLHISRDSAERAYRHLKKTGVIVSVPQKGYYIRPGYRGGNEKPLLVPGGAGHLSRRLQKALMKALGQGAKLELCISGQATLPGYNCYAIVPHGSDRQQNKQAAPVAFIMIR